MDQRKLNRLIKSILLFAVAVTLAGVNHRASAQGQPEIVLTARVGLDGYCKKNAWVPVHVTIENSGPDVDGRVTLTFQNSLGGENTYGQDIQLPTTSRKEFFLYIRPGENMNNLRVSLTSGGKSLIKKNLNAISLSRDNQLFGVLADNPSSYDLLKGAAPLRGNVKQVQFDIKDLPDRPQGWEALDVLVVARTDTGRLSAAQHGALETWLAKGGRLLVVGGPQWQATAAGLAGLLPVVPDSTRTVANLSALQEYFQLPAPSEGAASVATGRITDGATVLVEQDGLPLVVEKQFGFGRVIFLAADPSLQPLSGWDGMQAVYSQLLGPRPTRPAWMDGTWENNSAQRAVSTLHHVRMPAAGAVCGWLILYVVAIGPLNFFIMRRTKRRELAWFTIPALVILFSGMAYAYGIIYRGPRPILNRLAVVQAWDGSATAEVRGMVGLYSPRRATYTLETDDPFLLHAFAGGEQNRTFLQTAAGTSMPDVRVEIGGLQAASVQGSLPALELTHTLVLTLNDKGPVLTGAITNASQSILREAVLITPGGQRKFSDLKPGESRDVKITMGSVSGTLFYSNDPALTFRINSNNQTMDEVSLRRSALLYAAMLSDNGQNMANWGIYLMGWLDQPVLPVGIKGRAFDTIDTTLYIASLNPAVQFGPGPITIPPALFAWESSDESVSPFFENELNSNGYELRFRPAVPIRFSSVENLTLNLTVPNYINNVTDISAFLWDFQGGNWVEIKNLRTGKLPIAEPWHYVSQAGEIRLKIDLNNSSNWAQVDESSFTLVVNP